MAKCSFQGFLTSNKKMSSLALNRIMKTSSYRNFNLFKQHLGVKERYVEDMTEKDAIRLPLCECAKKGSYTFLLNCLDLLCLLAHYLRVLTSRYAPGSWSSLQQALFLVQPHTPTSLCLALRQSMKCALEQSPLSFDLQACRVQS